MTGPCRTCKHKLLTPRRNEDKCSISKWGCRLHKKLIGEGAQWDLEADKGCRDYEKQFEITPWNGK